MIERQICYPVIIFIWSLPSLMSLIPLYWFFLDAYGSYGTAIREPRYFVLIWVLSYNLMIVIAYH